MISANQNLMPLQGGNKGYQLFLPSTQSHIPKNVDRITICDSTVLAIFNVIVHLFQRIIVGHIFVKQMQVTNIIIHRLPPRFQCLYFKYKI